MVYTTIQIVEKLKTKVFNECIWAIEITIIIINFILFLYSAIYLWLEWKFISDQSQLPPHTFYYLMLHFIFYFWWSLLFYIVLCSIHIFGQIVCVYINIYKSVFTPITNKWKKINYYIIQQCYSQKSTTNYMNE